MFKIYSFLYWLSAIWSTISISTYIIAAAFLLKKRHPEYQGRNKSNLKDAISNCAQCCLLVLCPILNTVMAIWVTCQFEDFINYHLETMENRYSQNDEQ